MSCHVAAERSTAPPVLRLRARPLKVVLVGNPNVGKSVIFGRLTGRYATVSNYPGTTVGITSGRAMVGAEVCDVVDSPGVNALEGVLSEDEQVTRRLLANREADLVIQVADARNLRRALTLTAQVAGFGLPTVLVLNMVDEARRHGIEVDAARLAQELGVPGRGDRGDRRAGARRPEGGACPSQPRPASRSRPAATTPRGRTLPPSGFAARGPPSIGRFQEWLSPRRSPPGDGPADPRRCPVRRLPVRRRLRGANAGRPHRARAVRPVHQPGGHAAGQPRSCRGRPPATSWWASTASSPWA